MDYNLSGSLVYGILQARILEWVAISFSGGSSQPRGWTQVSCITGRFFTNWAMREAPHAWAEGSKYIVTAWITNPLEVYDLRQIMLVVLIPHAITKWSKGPGKGDWERKVWFTRFAHLWPLPSQGCWVSLGIGRSVKTLIRLPFWGLPSVITRLHETAEQGSSLACAGRVIHSHEHTIEVSKVKQKTCLLRKQRG